MLEYGIESLLKEGQIASISTACATKILKL
jgi:hypothetical protein